MRANRPKTLLQVLAMLAAVLLASGLPRFVVLCDHGDGDLHFEFVHAPGDCCDQPAQRLVVEGPFDGEGEPTGERATADPSCEHVEFAVDVKPEPRPSPAGPRPLQLAGWLPPLEHAAAVPAEGVLLPPATGPPRADGRTSLRRTTVLLL